MVDQDAHAGQNPEGHTAPSEVFSLESLFSLANRAALHISCWNKLDKKWRSFFFFFFAACSSKETNHQQRVLFDWKIEHQMKIDELPDKTEQTNNV